MMSIPYNVSLVEEGIHSSAQPSHTLEQALTFHPYW